MARIKGNTTPLLTLKVGAASAVDFGADVVSVEFSDGDNSQVTMSDYATGVAATNMTVTYVLDHAAAKAFQYHWTNAGVQSVTYAYRQSNAAKSQDNPEFGGTLTMPRTPLFAVEAGTDATTFEVEYVLDTWIKSIS